MTAPQQGVNEMSRSTAVPENIPAQRKSSKSGPRVIIVVEKNEDATAKLGKKITGSETKK